MPYIYSAVESLVTTPPKPHVGDGNCVPLVQQYAKCPLTESWKQGQAVRKNALQTGTAIATFVGGKYQSNKTGNHAALYVGQDEAGIWVVDQYKSSNGIQKRLLRFKGKNPDGTYVDPSNNGDAFSVIE